MDTGLENTLHNLFVLAAISHNDKLATNGERFGINPPTTTRGAMRMWYGERRETNIQRVQQCIRSARAHASRALEEAECLERCSEPTSSIEVHIRSLRLQHDRFVEAVARSRVGVSNLLATYRDDAAHASQIALVLQEIDDYLTVSSMKMKNDGRS